MSRTAEARAAARASKLLVVDDDPDVVAVLRGTLSSLAIVLAAASGDEALGVLRAERPRLVLLDLGLPPAGGFPVLRQALAEDPALAVVMLTADPDLSSAKRALDAGARAYITKPFDAGALREEVGRHLLREAAPGAPYRPWRLRP